MRKTLCIIITVALLGTTACSVNISYDADRPKADTDVGSGSSGGRILDGRWLNSDIIGNVTEDTSADLKDDFALYVNRDWSLNAKLPDGYASVTPLTECDLIIQERMKIAHLLICRKRFNGYNKHDIQLTCWICYDMCGV